MEAFVQRLISESTELSDKIQKLEEFIDSDKINALEEIDAALLEVQLSVMEQYLSVLSRRLARNGITKK